MTPAELKAARHALGLTAEGMARLFQMQGAHAGRTVRRWEDGSQDIPGYAEVILGLLLRSPQARKLLGVTLAE